MNVVQRLKCLLGRHQRDRSRVWYNTYRSYCAGCDRPMVRDLGGWRLANEAESVAFAERDRN